jgi:hypothetical protein
MGRRHVVERSRAVEAVRRLRRGETPRDWYPDPQIWQDWTPRQRRRWLCVRITSGRQTQPIASTDTANSNT